MMLDAKGFAEKAVKRFQTRNPFDIAESLGFDIIYVPLVGVRGFYQQLKRNKFIYINESLNDHQTRLVCAHELGHWFMHKKLNRLFLDSRTFFVTSRYETEANRFAVCLLYSDDDMMELQDCTIDQVACIIGVSHDLAEYRIRNLENSSRGE